MGGMKVRASDLSLEAAETRNTEFLEVCSALRALWLLTPWSAEKVGFARDHDTALTIAKIQD